MSLQKWLEYGWLRPHKTSRKEISDLLRITDRDLLDAAGDISADAQVDVDRQREALIAQSEEKMQQKETVQPLLWGPLGAERIKEPGVCRND